MKFPIKAKHECGTVCLDFDVPMKDSGRNRSRCVELLKRVVSQEIGGRVTDLHYKRKWIENDSDLREACVDAVSSSPSARVPFDVDANIFVEKKKEKKKSMKKYEKKKQMDPKKKRKQNSAVLNDGDISDSDSGVSEVGHALQNYLKDHEAEASYSKNTEYDTCSLYVSEDESDSDSDVGLNCRRDSCYKCGKGCTVRYWSSARLWDNLCGSCWNRGGRSISRSQWFKLLNTDIPRGTLSRGDNSEEVKLLQKRLYDLGFLQRSNADPSGYYGRRTEEAVQEFRNAFGIYGTSDEKNVFNSSAAKAMKRIVRDNVQNPV